MRTRHDLPVAWRLGAGFAAILVVMLAFGLLMLDSNRRGERAQQEFTGRHVPMADAGDGLERAVLYVGIGVRGYLLAPGPETRAVADSRFQRVRDALRRLEAIAWTDEDRVEVAQLAPLIDAYLAEAAGMIGSAPLPDVATAEGRLSAAREAALTRLRALVERQHARRDAGIDAMDRARDRVGQAGVAAFVLVLCILAFVGFYTLRSIQRPTLELVRIANAMRQGDWKPALEWSPVAVAARGEKRDPRSELARIAHAFGAAATALDRREARLRADARVSAATASSLHKEALAQSALDAIVEGAAARAGAFYTLEESGLVPAASTRLGDDDAARLAQAGIAHRAIDEREAVAADPGLLAVPLVFRDRPLGVIALAGSHDFDGESRDFIAAAAAQVAIGLANVRAHERVQRLAEEVQAQNEEIQAQMEEIQAQSEQLQVQNEEMQSQAEQIARSNDLLRQQAEDLTQADARKNEFLALLAHELRNPLAAIANSIFMLGHPQVQPAQAGQARGVIERQMRHLTRMIDDLLDVTRISRGKLRLHRESLDLAQLVREGLDDHRRAMENAGLSLVARVPDGPVRVSGDRTRLAQVLSNLISNAIKFSERGGRIEVTLEHAPAAREATLRVVDTGIGIEASLLGELFEPFRQGEAAHTRTNAGLGLGLALSRALVEMHGGRIAAHSAGPRTGAEFAVTLPLEGAGRPAAGARDFIEAGRRPDGIVSEDFGPGSGSG